MTAVENTFLTAAQFNVFVRDNLLETAPASALAANNGRPWFTTGPNAVADREINDHIIETLETTTSTDYVDLATHGPKLSMFGARYLIMTNAQIGSSGTASAVASYAIFSTTSSGEPEFDSPAIHSRGLIQDGGSGTDNRYGAVQLFGSMPAPGIYTISMKYLITSGAQTGSFQKRRLQVMGL